ncbi:MAG: phosphoribosyltransferase family protein [Rikenellaceae bacterium]
MSILSDLLTDLMTLTMPSGCFGCGKAMEERSDWICIRCMASIPSTEFHLSADNVMALKLRSLSPAIVNAAAQNYYVQGGVWSKVIKHMKYHSGWYMAYEMGKMYGYQLAESPLFQGIDFVVPVPLHNWRLLERKYNQADYIAQGIARAMGLKVNRSSLRRVIHNQSQVFSERGERWSNVQGIFKLRHAERFEDKHILLVDDVYTTGATLISCAQAIAEVAPTCRISVATLAASNKLQSDSYL